MVASREGVVKGHYISDATDNAATNEKWTSTTVQSYTVPDKKRWWLYGGHVKRDANETLNVAVYNAADELVLYLLDEAAATTYSHYPDDSVGAEKIVWPIPMEAGWYVKITCGGAQGAGATASCYVLEVGVY